MKKKKIKIAVFAIHRPLRAPNERYRWFQYEKFLRQHEATADYFYIVDEHDDQILFHSKNIFLKLFVYIKTFFVRLKQIKNLNHYDSIIIYRELHWFRFLTQYLLIKLKQKTHHLVFDFDDAIWLPYKNTIINCIKQPEKKTILHLRLSHTILAGNAYLADFALQHNSNTHILPTIVDTEYFRPLPKVNTSATTVCIGWMGSHSTVQHLKTIIPVLKKIKQKYPDVIFKFVGNNDYIPEIDIYIEKWNKENEIETINAFDIGIMPLPNDEWSKGKCGLKILTYLACGIPCVASDVGINKEIIEKTNGGFCCSTEDEWIEKLSLLIENKSLRIQLGQQGRTGIEKYYSINVWKDKFFQTISSS
ncbi:MAG: glycosyl transferase [Bacteroidia bacterium]|nr:MAG: glycosyl transferase [Bacteroidia bacterium]